MKFCTTCKKHKHLECFNKNKSNKGGVDRRCKECRSEYTKKWVPKKEVNLLTKKCSSCGKVLPIELFSKDRTKTDGKRSGCKYCDSQIAKKYRLKNPEVSKDSNKKFKLLNPDYHKNYHIENREKRLQRGRTSYYLNWEYNSDRKKKWKASNKNRLRAYSAKRRELASLSYNEFFKEELEKFYENVPSGMEVDHIIPLVNPNVCGLHIPHNLQYLDPTSNRSKGSKFDGSYENNSWIKS